ncbi:Tc toxin subunit A [Pseudomonas chlororaphis]|uniref:Tc toxin subunit A n=1 Tax=Pseudomonas chlororaphis TaxID=587753 RepID=UPI00167B588A|nr:Tc toxin subunit A [Pseudomonas chlororaphis]
MPSKRMSVPAMEKALGLPAGSLSELGLTSQDKIVGQKEPEFVESYGASLGESIARQLHQLALLGRASKAPTETLSTQGVTFENGPTYPYADLTLVPDSSVGNQEGPGLHLAELKALAGKLEALANSGAVKLDARRPDIGPVALNSLHQNQRLPVASYNNRLLENYIEYYKSSYQGLLGEEWENASVDQVTAALRYPPQALPYHGPFDQVTSGLEVSGVPLSAITRAFDSKLPALAVMDKFSERANIALQQAADLSPSSYDIATEPSVFSLGSDISFSSLLVMTLEVKECDYNESQENLQSLEYRLSCVAISELDNISLSFSTATKLSRDSLTWDPESTVQTGENSSWVSGGEELLNGECPMGIGDKLILNISLYSSDACTPEQLAEISSSIIATVTVNEVASPPQSVTALSLTSEVLDAGSTTVSIEPIEHYFLCNFGLSASAVSTLDQVPVFLQQTELSTSSLQGLLCVSGVGQSNNAVSASKYVDWGKHSLPAEPITGKDYGAVYIHNGNAALLYLDDSTQTIDGLDFMTEGAALLGRFDCLNRMIRLQREFQLPYDQLDTLIVATAKAQNQSVPVMNAHMARVLGFFREWSAAYKLTAEDLASFLYAIPAAAIIPNVSLFDRTFNSGASAAQTPLIVDNKPFTYRGADTDYVTVRQLCAGLQISEATFEQLADIVSKVQGQDQDTLSRSFTVISALYRLCRIAAYLQTPVIDLLTLLYMLDDGDTWVKQLAGVPSLAPLGEDGQPTEVDILDALQALAGLLAWQREQKITVAQLALLCTTSTIPSATIVSNSQTQMTLEITKCDYSALTKTLTATYRLTIVVLETVSGLSATLNQGYNALTGLVWGPGCDLAEVAGADGNFAACINNATPNGTLYSVTAGNYPPGFTVVLDISVTQANVDSSELSSSYISVTSQPGSLILQSPVFGKLPKFDLLTGTAADVTLINALNQQLAPELLSATSFVSLPSVDSDGNALDWFNLFVIGEVLDFSGLVLPQTDQDALKTAIAAVVAAITFPDGTDPDDITDAAFGLIAPAAVRQVNVSIGQLASTLSVTQTYPLLLLNWVGSSSYALQALCLSMRPTDGDSLQPTDIPVGFLQLLFNLQRMAAVIKLYNLTPVWLKTFLQHPGWFGQGTTEVTLPFLWAMSRYPLWCNAAGKEDLVLQYLADANSTDPVSNPQNLNARLARMLGWSASEVQLAVDAMLGTEAGTGVLTTSVQVSQLMLIQAMSIKTGLSVTPLLACSQLPLSAKASDLPSASAAYNQWQSAAQAVLATLASAGSGQLVTLH